jgi:hypothetical protein
VSALALRPRAEALVPVAAVAEKRAARALARRLLARDDAALARLAGLAAPGLLLVLGAADDLPWANGVQYLGRDPDAPALLLPTTLAPAAPLALVERALLARAGAASAPLAVLFAPLRLVPLGGARPVERARLTAWLEADG